LAERFPRRRFFNR
jgi:hypothetical protein